VRKLTMIRTIAAAAVLAAAALAAEWRLLRELLVAGSWRSGPNHLSRIEEALEPLRAELPRSGVIGYVTDDRELAALKAYVDSIPNVSASEGVTERALERYYMTQYAVAPLVLKVGAEGCELAIGSFARAESAEPSAAAAGMTVERRVGAGMALLRRKEKRE
jgi:hypothetical protein